MLLLEGCALGGRYGRMEPKPPSGLSFQSCAEAGQPLVPWPPPKSKWSTSFGNNLFSKSRTLGDIDSTLRRILQDAGYSQLSYFSAPGGFYLATQVEKVDAFGAPERGPERFDVNTNASASSIRDYFNQLLYDRVGYYRLFLFSVVSRPQEKGSGPASFEDISRWGQTGCDALPASVLTMKIGGNYNYFVYSYVFEGKKGSNPSQVESSFPPIDAQLRQSRLDIR